MSLPKRKSFKQLFKHKLLKKIKFIKPKKRSDSQGENQDQE